MEVLADTSGLFALLDADDINHSRAATAWQGILAGSDTVVSHSYVVSEALCLVQRRLGMEAVAVLAARFLPLVEIVWVDVRIHEAALTALLDSGQRRISLVDHVSFELMARRGITAAFAYDDDFRRAGFALLR